MVSEGEGLALDTRILREVGASAMKEPAVEDEGSCRPGLSPGSGPRDRPCSAGVRACDYQAR